MGTLKPGATYIYERSGDEIYARETGTTERKLIGYDYELPVHRKAFEDSIRSEDEEGRKWRTQLEQDKLWGEIRQAASTNPALESIRSCYNDI